MPITIVLAIVGFASAISFRNADPVLPLIAGDLGITIGDAALLATGYTLAYSLMQPVLGPVGDTFGKARLIKVCMLVLAAALVVSAAAPSYSVLMASRALAGGFAGGLIPVALAVLGDRIAFRDRQVAISRLLFATLAGQLTGSATAGVLAATLGWRGVFAFAAAITTVAALVVVASLKPTGRPRGPFSLAGAVSGYRDVFRNPRSSTVYFMVAAEGLLVFGSFPFVAPLLELHGTGSVLEAGFVITGFAVGGLVYTGLVGLLLRLLGQRRMMAIGGLLGGASLALAGLPLPWVGTALLFFGLGLGFFMVHNSLQTEASELAPRVRASAFAVFASLFFLGQGVGVVAVRESSALVGLPAVMAGLGVLVAGLGLFGAWKIGRPRAP